MDVQPVSRSQSTLAEATAADLEYPSLQRQGLAR